MEIANGAGRQGFLELVYGVLFNPTATFKTVALAPPLRQAALIYFLFTLLSSVSSFLFLRANLVEVGEINFPGFGRALTGLFPLVLFMALVFAVLKWFLYAAVFHFLAAFFGGTGSPQGTLVVCALAGLPGVFLVPVEVLFDLFQVSKVAATTLSGLAGVGVLVWELFLLVIGLREVHQLAPGSALIAVFLPVIALVCVFLFLILGLVFAAGVLVPSLP